ncbi:hypothetical protein V6N13_001282 [Hibiscus sabdariffa]
MGEFLQSFNPSVKFQYGDWLRATLKKKQEIPAPPKGRIRFHEEGGSSNSHSDFSTLGDDFIFGGAGDPLGAPSAHATFVHTDPLRAVPEPAKVSSPLAVANATTCLDEGEDDVVPKKVVVGTRGLNDVFVVDNSGRLHVAESVLLGDEHDVFVSEVSHAVDAPVTAAPAFDAIEEWLAENDDPDAPVQDEPPVKIHAKRSSSGSDPSKVFTMANQPLSTTSSFQFATS